MESKFCPALGGSCLGKDCGWFNVTADCCAIRLVPISRRIG